MNLFKKALVASAVAASFGASAATVSSTPAKLSAEGVAVSNAAAVSTLTFDVVVDVLHPASSTITLTFSDGVEFDTVAGCAGSVTQVVGEGTAHCGDIGFDYGTGSFTFDNVVVTDGDATKGELDSISFDVNLGNPLTASSAFRVIIGDNTAITGAAGTDTVLVSKASTVAYTSAEADDTAIETGTGVVATEVAQYSFKVKSDLDGIIERVDQDDFIDAAGNVVANDAITLTVSNDETLGLAITDSEIRLSLAGNFEDVSGWANTSSVVGLGAGFAYNAVAPSTDISSVTYSYAAADLADDGTAADVTLTFVPGTDIPVTGMVTASALVFDGTTTLAFPTAGVAMGSSADGGEWMLDATVINVPYFPVGFEGTSTSVHFANEDASVADVIVTAIDADGNTYGPLDLGMDLAGDTVTKVSQGAIMSLFGLTESAKLSVTFNIDADDGDVNAYAFTTDDTGRTEISNSQLKGK
jgi:hypothetical protein